MGSALISTLCSIRNCSSPGPTHDGTVVSNYNRQAAPTGINPSANINDFGAPLGWVDPRDLK